MTKERLAEAFKPVTVKQIMERGDAVNDVPRAEEFRQQSC